MNKKRIKTAIALLVAVLCIGFGVFTASPALSSAYFTDNEWTTNKYTFGNVKIDGTERNWDPEIAKHMIPNQVVDKDPRIENVGTNKAVGFIILDSPIVRNVSIADDSGSVREGRNVEHRKFLDSLKKEGFNTSNWTLMENYFIDKDGKNVGNASGLKSDNLGELPEGAVARRYVFGYKNNIAGGTESNPTKSDPLFNYIQSQNFLDKTFGSETEYTIKVYFLGIQAENLTLDNGVKTTNENTTNMDLDMLSRIFKLIGKEIDLSKIK